MTSKKHWNSCVMDLNKSNSASQAIPVIYDTDVVEARDGGPFMGLTGRIHGNRFGADCKRRVRNRP